MFYCTAPGLAMWVLDWGMRIYELGGKLESTITALGNGWFCLTLPLPRRRLDGCACHSPLAHFHIHHTESSIREIHPFTTITHLASQKVATPSSTSQKVITLPRNDKETVTVQFLFRKSQNTPTPTLSTNHPQEEKKSKEWTNKLASLVEEPILTSDSTSEKTEDPEKNPNPSSTHHTSLRLEGPYFTPAEPSRYSTVICLVAGTGISGAIAIAAAFRSSRGEQNPRWKRCVIFWSVRETEYIRLPFLPEDTPGLEVRPHLTGKGRARLDAGRAIGEVLECGAETREGVWVYLSGPNPFIESGERACRELRVAYYGARWS
ncbi:hypothetical protein ACLMJK_002289 [Lecanora helva]